MVEAAEISSLTGDLPSMGPDLQGTPDPIISLRTENSLKALSSKPNRITGWRKFVAAGAGGAALLTGTGAVVAPPSAEAGGNVKLYTAASGDNVEDLASIYCTPEYIAEYPQLAGGGSNVGGEPTAQTNAPIAEAAGGDTAAIQVTENANQRVIINFTNDDGIPLSISVPVCPSEAQPIEESWPYKTTAEAIKAWNSGKMKVKKSERWNDIVPNPQPFANMAAFRDVHAEGYLMQYPGRLIGVDKVLDDGNEVIEITVGMEGAVNGGNYLKRERFAETVRVSKDLDSVIGYDECLGLNIECPNGTFLTSKTETTPEKIYDKLLSKRGTNIQFVNEIYYGGDAVNEKYVPLNSLREKQTRFAADFYEFSYDAYHGRSVDSLKLPASVNANPKNVDPDKLPMTIMIYAIK